MTRVLTKGNAVLEEELAEAMLHAIDIGMGRLEPEILLPPETARLPLDVWLRATTRLRDISWTQIDFDGLFDAAVPEEIAGLVSRIVTDYLEPLLHPQPRSKHRKQQLASLECVECDTVIPLFVKRVME